MIVVSNKGTISSFDPEKIIRSVIAETGLDEEIAENVARDIASKLDGDAITTGEIREMVASELAARGLLKERNMYVKSLDPDLRFRLDKAFLSKYEGKQPKWGPLGYITYKRTYARYIEDEDRSEEFWETLKRVVEGVFTIQKRYCYSIGLPWDEHEAKKHAEEMYRRMWEFKLLPPGRGLWMMGTEFIEKHGSMALNNCAFVSTKDIDKQPTLPFEFLMDALMLGVGVGFDTRGAGKILIHEPSGNINFTIPDSRRGWVLALRLVLRAYFYGEPYPKFDYSKIRPKGARIKGFGGVASGPEPLKRMLEDVSLVLERRIGEVIRTEDIVDIMNMIGRCVVAGNVRRSAEIALGNIHDHVYLSLKDPEKNAEALKSHRWASNNSVIARKGDDYSWIIDKIAKNGEPGFVWLENARAYSRTIDPPDYKDDDADGVNPCGEQTLESFESCNLVETFPVNHVFYEDYRQTLFYAYMYAKTVTLLNTHWDVTNAVMLKNRRIGISQSGIIDAFVKLGRRTVLDWCDKGYSYLRRLDAEFSRRFCIPQSKKITTVKPSGTVSLLVGVSPGIHYPYAEYYIRRIRVADNSPLVKELIDAGYRYEIDEYDKKSYVFEFPVKTEYFEKCQKDVSVWEQVANAIDYQRYWSDNQVSITVSFKESEVKDLKSVLEFAEDKLKSISLLPFEEHGYKQAPYEEITKEEYEKRISEINPNSPFASIKQSDGVIFCDGDHCELDY